MAAAAKTSHVEDKEGKEWTTVEKAFWYISLLAHCVVPMQTLANLSNVDAIMTYAKDLFSLHNTLARGLW